MFSFLKITKVSCSKGNFRKEFVLLFEQRLIGFYKEKQTIRVMLIAGHDCLDTFSLDWSQGDSRRSIWTQEKL